MNPPPTMPSLGVLNLQEGRGRFRLDRYTPSEDIGYFVKHYWVVSWDLTDREPYPQEVLPNPCVNFVADRGRTGFHGAARSKFSYLLQGKGHVFGVKFRPGAFYPFLGQPVSTLYDRPVPVGELFRTDAGELEASLLDTGSDAAMVERMEAVLRPVLPERDERVPWIEGMVDRIRDDRSLTSVEALAEAYGLNLRKLQRLFGDYVGVSPKWVIRLYRLQNAAEAAEAGGTCDWSGLAAELGYHDQAHLIKDFKAVVGLTPDQYRRKVNR